MPVVKAVQPVFARSLPVAMLNAIKTVPGGPLAAAPHVRLFTAGPTPLTSAWTAADFTDCTFGGYDAQDVTFSAPVLLDDASGVALVGSVTFTANGSDPENVAGYLVEAGDGSQPMVAEYFQQVVPISADGDYITLALFIVIPFANNTDA